MRSAKVLLWLCALALFLPFLMAQNDPGQTESLGDAARRLRHQKAEAASGPAVPPTSEPADSLADAARRARAKRAAEQPTGVGDIEWAYRMSVRQSLEKEDFAALDEMAAQARAAKTRVPGGVWNLLVFYSVAGSPGMGEEARDADWQAHIARLKRWVAQRPESVTARIALADAYQGYGWKARGGGYVNTVSEDGWKLLNERMELAAKTLVEAYQLPTKCPYWFESMQALLRTEGIDKANMRSLFEKAVALEPTYNHFYKEYATYLLPKWSGEPGEAEAFAEETYKRIGGKQGAFLYFEIAGTIYCDCANEPQSLQLSWKRIQEGYTFMETTYGSSNLKRNRMALLAYQAGDRVVAHKMFAEIGDWDPSTWRSKAHFEQVRAWAQ